MSERLQLPDGDLIEQAAYWFTVLRNDECPVTVRKAFDLWLDETNAHRDAYREIERAWLVTQGLDRQPEMLGLRHSAILRSVSPPDGLTKRYLWRGIAAAMVLVGLGTIGFYQFVAEPERTIVPVIAQEAVIPAQTPASQLIETAVGERSTFVLDDGSTVDLNTATRLKTVFSSTGRDVFLLQGQALFSVTTDRSRPFVVYAGDKRITALGTEFEVRLDRSDVAVTLLEGKVEVAKLKLADRDAAPEPLQTIQLTAGQRVSGSLERAESVSHEAIDRALGWREGRLEFKDEALAEVVYEINRYSIHEVQLAEPALAELRVSGSFKAGSVDNFVSALTSVYPLHTEQSVRANGSRLILVRAGK
ncbi:MAG: FecR domain-containing protein [Pseudomonadota bacterium]